MATNTLIPPKAPNLPVSPPEYSKQYQDQISNVFRLYFTQIDNYTQASAIPANGTTANRPTSNLQIGQFYYDTTLGYPIWWSGSVWKNASGTTV